MAKVTERSYNGWVASRDKNAIGVKSLTVGTATFPGGVRSGDVYAVLGYVAREFHKRVEPLRDGWCWGYNYRQNRNASNLSCHSSGTAIDLNAPRHPNGRRGTFTAAQVKEIRKILAECKGVVQWGGDYTGTPDEMHFEIIADAARTAAAARELGASSAATEDDMTPEESRMLKELHALVKVPDQGYSWARAAHSQATENSKALDDISSRLRVPHYPFDWLPHIVNMIAAQGKAEVDVDVDVLAASLKETLADEIVQALAEKLSS